MKVYVARQPIFDQYSCVCGYELLYRNSDFNAYDSTWDSAYTTRELVVNVVTDFGVNGLTNGKYAFVNFDRELLMTNFPMLLDPKAFVIELLEDTNFDDEMYQRLQLLHDKHYLLALDDYTGQDIPDWVLDMVDIIKVDFRLTEPGKRKRIARKYAAEKQVLAEKIETEEEFLQAKEDGYTLFQGFYFSKPIIFSKSSAKISSITCMRMWKELNKRYASFESLTKLVRMGATLCYKFLVRINTMQFYRSHRVTAIKPALVRMGIREIRRWILLLMVQNVTGNANIEAIKTALSRAVFAERLVEIMGGADLMEDAYTVGIFSMIDVIMEENLATLLGELSVSDAVKDALLRQKGLLAELLHFIQDYETANWDMVTAFIAQYQLDQELISATYLDALTYADDAFTPKPLITTLLDDES